LSSDAIPGAQINVITKSGTNQLHGDAFEYYRGSALNAMDNVEKRNGLLGPARTNRNQAGFDIGAPIIKDRTFIFGLLQADRQRFGLTPGTTSTIPTPAGFAALNNVPLRAASSSAPAQTVASRQAVLQSIGFLNDVYKLNPTFSRHQDRAGERRANSSRKHEPSIEFSKQHVELAGSRGPSDSDRRQSYGALCLQQAGRC
jgi:hypothetical protein